MRAPLLTAIGTFSILTLPGDDGTWSVTLCAAAGDQPLKRLRDAEAWTRVLQACPKPSSSARRASSRERCRAVRAVPPSGICARSSTESGSPPEIGEFVIEFDDIFTHLALSRT